MKRQETYKIEGMTCASCSSTVERVTGKLEGVDQVSVNLATEKMNISFDESLISKEAIFEKIEKAGYHPKENDSDKEVVIPVEGMT